MKTDREIDDSLEAAREALALYADLIAKGERGGHELYEEALVERELLVALLDEAPPEKLPAVEDLVDLYDALLKAIAH